MNSRDAILGRVRDALAEGRRAGASPPLPERGAVGYQGAGPDPLAKFLETCRAMGAVPSVAANRDDALTQVRAILDEKSAKKVLLGSGSVLDSLHLDDWLRDQGCDVVHLARGSQLRDELFAADVGITGVTGLIAETGSLLVTTSPTEPRSGNLLPPVHIAIARRDQLIADLFDVFEKYSDERVPSSNLVLITGPSKTGDIELKLVTGVHGPGEVYVIILDA
jgi:L-lactate dehydrogenase complex protein LldG